MRRLMHYGQILQSHALHFFHLSSPDLLFGFDSEVAAAQHRRRRRGPPGYRRQGVLLRKFGQEVIRITAGKRVHGTGAIPGGVNKRVSAAERDCSSDIAADAGLGAGRGAGWPAACTSRTRRCTTASAFPLQPAVAGARRRRDGPLRRRAAPARCRRPDPLRRVPDAGLPRPDPRRGQALELHEVPFLRVWPATGLVPVGPLARVQNCDFIPSPLAEAERQAFIAWGRATGPRPLAYHWARMIEMLHAAEVIAELLDDDDLLSGPRMASGPRGAAASASSRRRAAP
jgi:NAD-reducing hydrogenase large subunit